MAAKHPSQLPHSSLLLFLLLILNLTLASTSDHPDLHPLMNFKSSSDPSNRLSGWNYSAAADLCNWTGVSCRQNRVSRLVLENLGLNGSFIEPLTSLTHLRVLSLKSNSLSGPIPPSFSNLTSLKLLFLSRNSFSGEFPPSLLSLSRLFRLDLSRNNFSGPVPSAAHLTHLLTLRLEENNFSGPISNLDLPLTIQDFNVSGNRLSGEIPKSLASFPVSAFSGNTALCGGPLAKKCQGGIGSSGSSDPTRPGGVAIASPLTPGVVSSSPSSLPTGTSPKKPAAANSGGGGKSSTGAKITPVALIAIIVGDMMILAVVSLLLYCYFWKNYSAKLIMMRKGGGGGGKLSTTTMESEKIVYSSSPYPDPARMQSLVGGGGRGMAAMVFFEGAKRFELEDLLRASAEMLGKGGFGTAYKAVLDDGHVVAVKRLKDANIVPGGSGGGGVGGKMEQHMEILGRLRHPNLVSLKAYYFAREEKLLVYDYMPNGSLFWLLHGNRGPGRTPLDWNTRLKIAAGAARGLAFIHSSCSSLKLTHGNIKSTNVLLDQSGNARVSDFGLSLFASSSSTRSSSSSNGYRAPESNVTKLTQKSDVYSFGVLLLEMLTGKCPNSVSADHYGGGSGGGAVDLPRWVQSVVREEWTAEVFDLELMRYKDIEEEMVGLLQIAMVCSSPAPDQRPKMGQVVKMIEELRGVVVDQVSPGFESLSDSPSLSEGTATSQ
ncbi:Probable leucine-rich repeat receptor-like protein kinase At1g68400 [Linum grandiflorum]